MLHPYTSVTESHAANLERQRPSQLGHQTCIFPYGYQVYPGTSLSKERRILNERTQSRSRFTSAALSAHREARSRGPPALEEVPLRRSFPPSGSLKSPFENTFEIGGSCERLIKSRVIQITSHACEVWTIASKSLAIRLLRLNTEKVRSTTQRRGRGKASKRLVPWKATDEVKPRGVV